MFARSDGSCPPLLCESQTQTTSPCHVYVGPLRRPSTPNEITGKFAEVAARHPSPPASESQSTVVANIIVQHDTAGRGLRTHPTLVHDFSHELRIARTTDDIAVGAALFRKRLLDTGCYRRVQLVEEPVAERPGAVNIKVTLDENSFTVNTGAATTMSGAVSASTDFALLNPTGHGETLTVSVGGSSSGEISLSDTQGLSGPLFGPGLGTFGTVAAGLEQRLPKALAPSVTVTGRVPTIMGFLTPLDARLRVETDRHDGVSGYSNNRRDAELTVTDPSGEHSLTYTCALRDVVPRALASSDSNVVASSRSFLTGASAEVCAEAGPSLKSSLTYAFARNRFSHPGCSPPAGYRTALTAEVAGLGGDVSFLKATLQHSFAASIFRFAPDTGFALPPTRRAFLAPGPYDFTSGSANERDAAGLRPHPGPSASGWFGRAIARLVGTKRGSSAPLAKSVAEASAGSNARPPVTLTPAQFPGRVIDTLTSEETTLAPLGGPRRWTAQHQIAGWLSPGITLRTDVSLGALVPFGDDTKHCPTGSRIVDRFFLAGPQVRGFESVGPRAAHVPGGAEHGDALGGNAMMAASARLLLPPPLPSITLSNAGLRTQVFAAMGLLLPSADPARLLRAPTVTLQQHLAASAGIGLVSK